jgi:ATP-dependent RNA helicase DHX57
MILFGAIFNCLDAVLTMAACLSYRSPFVAPFGLLTEANLKREQFCREGERSDHLAMLRAYQGWLGSGCRIQYQRMYCEENYLSHKTLTMLVSVHLMMLLLKSAVAARGTMLAVRKYRFYVG